MSITLPWGGNFSRSKADLIHEIEVIHERENAAADGAAKLYTENQRLAGNERSYRMECDRHKQTIGDLQKTIGDLQSQLKNQAELYSVAIKDRAELQKRLDGVKSETARIEELKAKVTHLTGQLTTANGTIDRNVYNGAAQQAFKTRLDKVKADVDELIVTVVDGGSRRDILDCLKQLRKV